MPLWLNLKKITLFFGPKVYFLSKNFIRMPQIWIIIPLETLIFFLPLADVKLPSITFSDVRVMLEETSFFLPLTKKVFTKLNFQWFYKICVCVCGEIEFWHASTLEIIPIIFSDISSIQASSVKWNRYQKFWHWIYWWECGTDASRPRWRTFQLVRKIVVVMSTVECTHNCYFG